MTTHGYMYTPHTSRTKKTPLIRISIILILVAVFGVGLLINRLIMSRVYAKKVKKIELPENMILPAYESHVAAQTDSKKLAQIGDGLLKKHMHMYAALNFKRASDIDPNYRDAAYGWGYAMMLGKETQLTSEDIQAIHQAIERVEKVDPLYLPMLKLKLALAKIENDTTIIQATEARMAAVAKAQ